MASLFSNVSYRLPQVSSWVVYAGIVTRSSAKMAQHRGYAVEKIIYNKNYNHRSHDSDIALMKLRTPLNFSGKRGRLIASFCRQTRQEPPNDTTSTPKMCIEFRR